MEAKIVKQTITVNLGDETVQFLRSADERLGVLIDKIGSVSYSINDNHFERLAMSIIGQQLSPKAAGTIAGRVRELCPEFTPSAISQVSTENLRTAGLSGAKVSYIRDLCEKITENQLPFHLFDQFDNDAVIQALTSVKGIGKWTSEMFLIFSLGRTDVLSFGDAGLQRAAKWLYAIDRPDGKYLEQYGHKWAPYRSIASLYLWEAIDSGLIQSSL
jgi:DNA-3-methyladenine glycosylase II